MCSVFSVLPYNIIMTFEILFLALLDVLVNFPLLFSQTIYGDWAYRPPELLIDTYLSYNSFESWKIAIRYIEYIFGRFGYSSITSDTFVYHIWTIILPLVIIILLKRLLRISKYITFPLGLLLIANSYTLSINSIGHNLLSISSNLFIISFIFLLFSIKRASIIKSDFPFSLSILFLLLSGSYDFRIFYIGFALLITTILFFLFFHVINKKYALSRIVTYIIIVPIYFIPLILDIFTQISSPYDIGEILSRPIYEYMQLNTLKAITLFHPYWSLTEGIQWFSIRKVPFYFAVVAIIPFISLFVINKIQNKFEKKLSILMILIGVISVFLAKQTTSPFGFIYRLLYAYFPGFSAYRESTKFYNFIILSYLFLNYFSLNYFLQSKNKNFKIFGKILVGLLSFIFLINIYAILSSKLPSLYHRSKPQNVISLIRDSIIKDPNPYRTLWINSPILYSTSKYRALAIHVSNISLCEDITDYYNNAIINMDAFLSTNRIQKLYVNNEISNLCIHKLFKSELIPSSIKGEKLITPDQTYLITEYIYKDYKDWITINDPKAVIEYSSSQSLYHDEYFNKISILPSKNTILLNYPTPYSKFLVLFVNGKIYHPINNFDNSISWNIFLKQNEINTIYFANLAKLIVRFSVFIQFVIISALLLLSFYQVTYYEKSK